MNAGTLRELLIRYGYCNRVTVWAWFSGWSDRITINDVPACTVERVLERGDVVKVNGVVYGL